MILGPFHRSRRVLLVLLLVSVIGLIVTLVSPRSGHAAAPSVAQEPSTEPVPAATPTQPQPPSYTFLYLMGTDTIAVERVTARDTVFLGVLSYKGQPRIEWDQVHAGQVPGALTLRVYRPGAASDDDPAQQFVFTGRGDSVRIDITGRGATQTQHVASQAGAFPLIGQSVAHIALLSRAARAAGRATVPMFMTSGAQTLEAQFEFRGDTSTFTLAGMAVRTVWHDGVPTEVTIPAQGLRVVRAIGAVPSPMSTPETIDYGAPADAPYTAEAVVIPTPRGYTLAGTLTRPRSAGRVPVVVTISGSGPQERDSRIPFVKGYAPFRDLADTLGRRGIAVLRYDDRGVGESGGASSRGAATSADFGDDVQAVIAYLRTRADIDGARIGLAGHSEGGVIAPLVAAKDPTVRAVALLAGTAYNGRRILEFQNENGIKSAPGLSDVQRDSLRRTVPAGLDSLQRNNPWMRFFMQHDPLPTARALKQPVLIVQGNTDMQVTPEQADTLAAAIRGAGNRQVTLRRFPATNHLLLADPSGAPQGYATLTNVRVRADILGTIADWFVTSLR